MGWVRRERERADKQTGRMKQRQQMKGERETEIEREKKQTDRQSAEKRERAERQPDIK